MDMYECHVTVLKPADEVERERLKSIAQRLHWKTSEIDGDPILGKKVFFYFTSYGADYDGLAHRMYDLRNTLESPGIDVPVIRMKIEQIVFDWRVTDEPGDEPSVEV